LKPKADSLKPKASRRGVALIVVMWIIVIVSLIVSSFAFEMNLEGKIISAQRKRFKADQLALSGIEMAKAMLAFEEDPLEGDEVVYDDPWLAQAAQITEGVPASFTQELDGGTISLKIDFEKGQLNIKNLDIDEWHELFTQTGVPSSEWDELLGCLTDWEDENDLSQLNGAESDDFFYRERGYECKNAPIDTIDELLLIKGWTEEIVYGTPTGEVADVEYPMTGVAQHLTIWGDGKINPNSASREVLSSLYIDEYVIDAIMELRLGPDGEPGTEDDGLTEEDFNSLGLDSSIFTLAPEYVKITSEGKVDNITSQIYSVFKLGEKEPTPLFWSEER
jgi:general secretion pathway protein K